MRMLRTPLTNSTMNIVMVVPSISRCSGGVGVSVQNMARQIQGLCDVKVLSTRDSFSEADATGWLPVIPTIVDQKGPRNFGYAPDLWGRLRRTNADLIHCHGIWMYPSTAARSVARRHHIPLVVSPHGMLDPWALRKSRWKKRVVGWLFENRNLHAAACIHALCESEYQSIRDYGLGNPVAIIPNGIDLPAHNVESAPPWAAGVHSEKRVLLFLGRIDPKKNVHGLIQAWHELRHRRVAEEWVLVIAGWSRADAAEYERKIRQLVVNLGLEESVVFSGALYDQKKAAAFVHADGFILPSYSEGLPMAVLEAWVYELPVLMTAECNLPVGFAEGAAVEIRPSAESIARGLAKFLLASDEERHDIGRNGRRLVQTAFSWSQVVEQMHSVYRWCLQRAEKPDYVRLD